MTKSEDHIEEALSLLKRCHEELQDIKVKMNAFQLCSPSYEERLRKTGVTVGVAMQLLSASEEEKGFLVEIIEKVDQHKPEEALPIISIFADWLEDNLRVPCACRLRKLLIQNGDILVWQFTPWQMSVSECVKVAKTTGLMEYLAKYNIDCLNVILPHGASLNRVDPEEMEKYGWVRKKSAT